MKKILLFGVLALSLLFVGCQKQDIDSTTDKKEKQETLSWLQLDLKNIEATIEEQKKDMDIEYDEFTKHTTIKIKNANPRRNVSLYIRKVNDINVLKVMLTYIWNDWIFFNKVMFLINWETYDYHPEDRVDEVLHGGKVFEWSEDLLNEESETIIKKIIKNNSVKIRMQWDTYYEDLSLKADEISAIKKVYELYKNLEERSRLRNEINELSM